MSSEVEQAKIPENDGLTTPNVNGDVVEEIVNPQNITLIDQSVQRIEELASTGIGQVIIEKTDRGLEILEKTVKWSLPQDNPDLEYERPLPWLLFLPLIIYLRAFRIWLSIGFYLVHGQTVTAYDMVNFIQMKRRHLKALCVRSLKSLKKRRLEAKDESLTFLGNIKTLLVSAICNSGRSYKSSAGRHIKKWSKKSPVKSRYDGRSDMDLNFHELLEKYAEISSENDSDYVPKENEDDSSDTSSSGTSDNETVKAIEEKNSETAVDDKNGESDQQATPATMLLDDVATGSGEVASAEDFLSTPEDNWKRFLASSLEEKDNRTSTPDPETTISANISAVSDNQNGSPRDLHSIYPSDPLVKGSKIEDQTSTPMEAESHRDGTSQPATVVTTSIQTERPSPIHFNTPCKNKNQYYQSHQNSKKRYYRNRR